MEGNFNNISIKYNGAERDFNYFVAAGEKIRVAIQAISDQHKYFNRLSFYRNWMQRISKALVNDGLRFDPNNLPNLPSGLCMADEIVSIINQDNNMLKRLAFQEFARVAIAAEVSSLRADVSQMRSTSKGLRGRFGKGKESLEKAEDIEKFIEINAGPKSKGDRGYDKDKKYSYNEILAEMELFKEDRKDDPNCQRAIQRINELQQILNGVFYSTNPNRVKAKMHELREKYYSASSPIDVKKARIRHLDDSLDYQGIPAAATEFGQIGEVLSQISSSLVSIRDVHDFRAQRQIRPNPYDEI